MYCSACGQPMDAYQPFCPRCGRQATPIATPTPPPWIWTRVHRHVHTLGILWIVYAGWMMLHWMLVVPFLAGIFRGMPFQHVFEEYAPYMPFDRLPFLHMPWFLGLVTAALAVRAVLCLVTGIALLRRSPWARVLAIVTAFLTLIRPITGTALAIYTLWVLLPGASGQEYEQIAAPQL